MSGLTSLVSAIEADAVAAAKWVESEVETIAEEAVSAILVPFFNLVEPQIIASFESVLATIAKDAGTTVLAFLTGTEPANLFTEIAQAAEAAGATLLATLAPEAVSALVSLKTLALQGVTAVESAI